MTIQELAQLSIDIQDACNLSGVVHSFSRAMEVLWADAREHGHGTDWVNTHPIVTLYIDKLTSLNHYASAFEAWPRVETIAKGEVTR